jgi:hypothetical protein
MNNKIAKGTKVNLRNHARQVRGQSIKAASFILLLILALSTAFPLAVQAKEITTNEDGSVVITESWNKTDEVPAVEKTIEIDGKTFELIDTDEAKEDTTVEQAASSFTRKQTKEIPKEDIDNLSTYFQATWPIAEGDFSGRISIVEDEYDIVPVYEKLTGQVDKVHVFENLPDNDVLRIPKTYEFLIRSDEEYGKETQATLTLNDVVFSPPKKDHLGRPGSYSATCTYRGKETWLEIHHYVVSATYRGTITAANTQLTQSKTYAPLTQEVITPPVIEEEIVDDSVPLTQIEDSPVALNLAMVASAALAAGTLTAGSVLFFWFRRRAFKVCIKSSGNTLKPVLRRKIMMGQRGLCVMLPKKLDLTKEQYFGILPKRYLNKDMYVEIYQAGQEVYFGEVLEVIYLIGEVSKDKQIDVAQVGLEGSF